MNRALTDRQQYWLGHLRAAIENGEALSAYARRQGLSVAALHQAKKVLKAMGAMEGSINQTRARTEVSSPFVAVKIEPARASVVCELTHASGWTLKFSTLPSAEWLNAWVSDAHAAA